MMAEDLKIIESADKTKKYESLIPQIKGLIDGETDLVANLANICAALKEGMGFLWVGFYVVRANELVLGPFQGPVACTRIAKGKGVCGAVWLDEKVIIVEDVDTFPGHITCSSLSKSEIVLPVFKNGKIVAVLDVDSERLANFDEADEKYLKAIIALIEHLSW